MSHVVLFVDDEANLLYAMARRLRNEPYQIHTARTAEESIEILKAHSVDLIVSDENMPGMTGTKFLAWVAEVFPDIPRIMLTGQNSEPLKMRALDEGAVCGFFTKPCDVDKLARAIREALEWKETSLETIEPQRT